MNVSDPVQDIQARVVHEKRVFESSTVKHASETGKLTNHQQSNPEVRQGMGIHALSAEASPAIRTRVNMTGAERVSTKA